MKITQSRGLQAFRRAQAWIVEHPEAITESGTSAPALTNQLTALAGVVTRMTEQATEQVTQKGQATLTAKDETTLRSDLRKVHIASIVQVAKALRGLVPGIGVVAMPPARLRSERLVAEAEALSATAGVYKDVLVEHGLPRDFLEQLAAATSALKASIDARGVALSKRTGATTGLSGDYDLGRRIVAMIDAGLTHALKSDPVLLASWRQAKRATVKGSVSHAVPLAAASVVGDGLPVIAHGSVSVLPGAEPVAPTRLAA